MVTANPGKLYAKAPITEAVIELRFGEGVQREEVLRAANRFRGNYPHSQPIQPIDVKVDVNPEGAKANLHAHDPIHRLSSLDQTEISLLGATQFTISQLAPYRDWNTFFGRFTRDWKEWKDQVGYRRITRVGVRYINRIDIPNKGEPLRIDEWVRFTVDVPDELGPVAHFAAHAILKLPEINGQVAINAAHIVSPLVDHVSVVLDLDVSRENDLPQNDIALFELLSEIRNIKNVTFEYCLTDSARELFKQ